MKRSQASRRPQSHAGARPRRAARSPHSAEAPPEAGSADGGNPDRALLAQAVQALSAVLTFEHPADAVLSQHFRANRRLGHRDRAFIAETVYAVLRRLRWLRRLAGNDASPRMLLLAWLARGEGWSLRRFDDLASANEAATLAAIKGAQLDEGTLAERLDMPDWLIDALSARHTAAELTELAHSLNRPAPLDLRANILKTDRDALLRALRDDGIVAEPCPYAPQGIRLQEKPALHRHALFVDGHFEVQDEGSQLLGHLLQPRRGEMVVDFCAGAGGKTLLLGALMRSTGRLYALDVSPKRLAKLKPRLARSGLSNVHPLVLADERDSRLKRMAGKADRVLVDAPCSGLGTLRRNPDLKWRQTPETVAEMTAKQSAILVAAARLVRSGGRLVYATCSLLDSENERIAEAFLAADPSFRRLDVAEILAGQDIAIDTGEYLRLSPQHHHTDGFFAAVFERQA